MNTPEQTRAINPLPPVVVAVFLIFVGIELVFQLGTRGLAGGPEAVGWRLEAVQRFAFSGDIMNWMWQTGQWPMEHLFRFVSYPFVHLSFTQALFAGVMFLAMGKMTAEVFGPLAMLAVFFASAIGGAIVYAMLGNTPIPLVGAFPPIYGLIGSFTWLLWRRLSMVGENQARAFSLIGFLMAIPLVFALFVDIQKDWIADLAGFATEFLLSFVVSPGGWTRLVARLRQQ